MTFATAPLRSLTAIGAGLSISRLSPILPLAARAGAAAHPPAPPCLTPRQPLTNSIRSPLSWSMWVANKPCPAMGYSL